MPEDPDDDDLEELRNDTLQHDDDEKRRQGKELAEKHGWEKAQDGDGYIDSDGCVRNAYGERE